MDASNSAEYVNAISTVLTTTSNSYANLISAFQIFLGFIGILFGANFIWNTFVSNKKINSEVDEMFKNAEKSFNKKLEIKILESQQIIKKEVIDDTNKRMRQLECEQARNFALSANQASLNEISLCWWFKSLELAIEVDMKAAVGRSTGAIKDLLEDNRITGSFEFEDLSIKDCEKIAGKIPEYLFSQKNYILKKLKELEKNHAIQQQLIK